MNNPLLRTFRLIGNNIAEPLPVGLFDNNPEIIYYCHGNNPSEIMYPEIFRGLTKMTTLHIFGTRITEFANCLLRPMTNLTEFNVQGSQVKVLDQKSFPPTKNRLQRMLFDRNQIEAIDRRVFDDTPVLSSVNLNGNICTNLSVSNFNSNRTYYMSVLEPCFAEYDRRFPAGGGGSSCKLYTHPVYGYTCELVNYDPSVAIMNSHDECLSNADVTGLIFTDTKISQIPAEIFSTFKSLMYIQAIDSGLESAMLVNCTETLIYIDVSQNSIHSLPSDAFNCENLETIIVDDNCISSIQSCETTFVENLKNLKTLSMKKTFCVDNEFDLEEVSIEEIEMEMKKCFKMWYLM